MYLWSTCFVVKQNSKNILQDKKADVKGWLANHIPGNNRNNLLCCLHACFVSILLLLSVYGRRLCTFDQFMITYHNYFVPRVPYAYSELMLHTLG